MSECKGHCCRAFFIDRSDGRPWPDTPEGRFVKDMLIPLVEYSEDDCPEEYAHIPRGKKGWFYTCKHHCKETGRCKIYERRPPMCSTFPGERECPYEGCSVGPDSKGVERWLEATVRWQLVQIEESKR